MKIRQIIKSLLIVLLLVVSLFSLTGCAKKDAKMGFTLYLDQLKNNEEVVITSIEERFSTIYYVTLDSQNKIYYKAPFKQSDTKTTYLYFYYNTETNEVFSSSSDEYDGAITLHNNRYRGVTGSFKFFDDTASLHEDEGSSESSDSKEGESEGETAGEVTE